VKKKVIVAVLAAVILCLTVWVIWANEALELNCYRIENERLPESFAGYRIAQISDLHNAEIGKNNEKLLAMLKEADPDLIAITGDMIDSRRTDIDVALQFAGEVVQIAPCYYVTGNHEARVDDYETFKSGLQEAGVTVLENSAVQIERGGATITLIGVMDPAFPTHLPNADDKAIVQYHLAPLVNHENYTVLLSHRPELFHVYVGHEIDLVLSGHVHGGQFRLPLLGGIFAPGQGFFPKYDAGFFAHNNSNMIVSRGIGNSIIPLRINNRPELVLIELQS
jgi:predicted MPP superfamily phosphohydrolase